MTIYYKQYNMTGIKITDPFYLDSSFTESRQNTLGLKIYYV